MKPHIRIYFDSFRIDPTEVVLCEMCASVAVDIHHINARGSGGDPQKKKDRIENLQAVCRECHQSLGDQKIFKHALFTTHKKVMQQADVTFCENWIDKQIERYK